MRDAEEAQRRISLSRMLELLGVSRSGDQAWLTHEPSKQQKHKEALQERIQVIYDESHQNYGAPQIAKTLHHEGETITEKTVGNYIARAGDKGPMGQAIHPQQAHQLVFEYLEAFYNTVRIHSHCDYLSPGDFEKLYDSLPSMADQYSC